MTSDPEDAKSGLDVGILCQGWVPDVGGVESHTSDLAGELRSRGHRVHVLCLDYGRELEPYTTSTSDVDGVDVRRMAYLYQDHRGLADIVRNPEAEDVVLAWLGETPCDVVHVHHATGFGLGALRAIHAAGRPLVMTLHDYWALCPRGQMVHVDGSITEAPDPARCGACLRATWPHLMPLEGSVEDDSDAAAARTRYALACLALPQRLLAPSGPAQAVFSRAGIDPERIEVCENGIDVGRLRLEVERFRAERSRADGEVRLGVIGTILPSKGVLELARAFRAADAPGLTLEIHGNAPSYHGDSSYVESLRTLAAGDGRIRLHGPFEHAELASILADLDGVAAPSRWEEVFGLTVREARAAGLPVLVSDAGDLPRIADAGRAGVVVPRDDEGAWMEALRRFAVDVEAREAWRRADVPVRTAHEMMLQLERAYVETIEEVTGRSPSLAHPIVESGGA